MRLSGLLACGVLGASQVLVDSTCLPPVGDAQVWNVPAAPKSIRDVTRGALPTLAISGSFDAQTGAQWGQYAARTLSDSKVVTVPGVAHAVYINACGARIIVSFLDNPAAPDTSCISQEPPTQFTIGPPAPEPVEPTNPDDLR